MYLSHGSAWIPRVTPTSALNDTFCCTISNAREALRLQLGPLEALLEPAPPVAVQLELDRQQPRDRGLLHSNHAVQSSSPAGPGLPGSRTARQTAMRDRPRATTIRRPGTDVPAYADRLQTLEQARWKQLLDVQAPYRWNIRRLGLGRTLDVGCGLGRNLAHLGGAGRRRRPQPDVGRGGPGARPAGLHRRGVPGRPAGPPGLVRQPARRARRRAHVRGRRGRAAADLPAAGPRRAARSC